MSIQHKLLAASYQPLKLLKQIGTRAGMFSPNCLRVLLYHDIVPQDHDRFAKQLHWLAQSWRFVSPEQFSAMVTGAEPVSGRNVLLTFDDGFASNRVVAEKILNPLGIKALFFIVSKFAGIEEHDEARCFIAENIYPGLSSGEMGSHWYNMSWSDLEAMLEQGHYIGAHTRNHTRLSQITDSCQLESEIVGCADDISDRLGIAVEHFAYSFGDIESFSKQALEIAKSRFRFIYTGLRGDNSSDDTSAYVLRRDASASIDSSSHYSVLPNNLLGSFLEGMADYRYAKDYELFRRWNGMAPGAD